LSFTVALAEAPMSREIISTPGAPKAIGAYSQAVRVGTTVYLSGQIPLDPATGEMIAGDVEAQVRRVFENLKAVAEAAGSSLAAAVKLTVFLLDLKHFPVVNQVMAEYFREPYPARATVGVAQLPRGAQVEVECILET
jgi:reactive intermediate/imine deaminase